MKEIKAIVNAYELWKSQGHRMALAMVVKVEGSAYRKEGARMLVTDHGAWVGAISGGCLEGYILEYCQQVFDNGKPLLMSYDSEKEEDRINGIGLGCNGKISFLIQEIDTTDPENHLELLKLVLANRKTHVLLLRYSYFQDEVAFDTCLLDTRKLDAESAGVKAIEEGFMEEVLTQKRTQSFSRGDGSFLLLEYLRPAIQLIIAGGGNDVVPLVEIATVLGWDVTVLDRRPEFADSKRFIPTCRVVHSQVDEMLDKVTIDEHTAIALMTHNFYCDQWLFQATRASNAFYIGLLGPRKKFARIIKELEEKGTLINLDTLPQVFNPVGLDIGAESAEEIALAVIAEIQAVRKQRDGRSLKWRNAMGQMQVH